MSDVLKYNEKNLGYVHSYIGDGTNKFDLEMEGIGGLEQLFRLFDGEELEVEGIPPMTYRDFKDRILSRTKRIYLSTHEYNLDTHPAG